MMAIILGLAAAWAVYLHRKLRNLEEWCAVKDRMWWDFNRHMESKLNEQTIVNAATRQVLRETREELYRVRQN